MKSIKQIHVDVSTPKKAKKVARILSSFPTGINLGMFRRLIQGIVHPRHLLIGCDNNLGIWRFVDADDLYEVVSPKKLKKMLSQISLEHASKTPKSAPKDIHDIIKESLECPPFSNLQPSSLNGTTIRKIDFDEGKGLDGMTLERLHKLGRSFDGTATFMTDFAKKMAIKPILIDPELAKILLKDFEKPRRTFDAIPFTKFYFSKLTPFQQNLIDPWKNTLFNFPLPPFKNILKEWLKTEEEKAIAIKKQQQSIRMPRIGDLVKAYDDKDKGMVTDFEGVMALEDKESTIGILTNICQDGSDTVFRVNDAAWWNYAETITLEEAREIYNLKKSS